MSLKARLLQPGMCELVRVALEHALRAQMPAHGLAVQQSGSTSAHGWVLRLLLSEIRLE